MAKTAQGFHSFFVRLDHSQPAFTGHVLVDDHTIQANFKKISPRLYIIYFQNQYDFRAGTSLAFKNNNRYATVLLPVISKYNKRKLKKIDQLLQDSTSSGWQSIFLRLLEIEKFLKLEPLCRFFSLQRQEVSEFLIDRELDRVIKIIDFSSLYITPYGNYLNYLDELRAIFEEHFQQRIKTIPFSEIEKKLKLSPSSRFFRYLLSSLEEDHEFKILNDHVLLQKIALSQSERKAISHIHHTLRKHRLPVFTIETIDRLTELPPRESNNALWFMIEDDQIVQLDERYYMTREELTRIINRLKKYKRNQGEMIDIQALRELTSMSRKFLIPLFEYLDEKMITQRMGNQRKILLSV